VAESLYFAGIFLAPYSRGGAFWNCIRDCLGPGILGDVWGAKKLRTALAGYFKSAEKINKQ
jgi:hypothetical protein